MTESTHLPMAIVIAGLLIAAALFFGLSRNRFAYVHAVSHPTTLYSSAIVVLDKHTGDLRVCYLQFDVGGLSCP